MLCAEVEIGEGGGPRGESSRRQQHPKPPHEFAIGEEEVRNEQTLRQVEPNEALDLAPLDPRRPKTTFIIGSRMGLDMRHAMKKLLEEHQDVLS